jgi:hypothetical protein
MIVTLKLLYYPTKKKKEKRETMYTLTVVRSYSPF